VGCSLGRGASILEAPGYPRRFASTSPPLWNIHSEHWRRPFGDQAEDGPVPTTNSRPKTARERPVRHPWPLCGEAARAVFSRLPAAMTPRRRFRARNSAFCVMAAKLYPSTSACGLLDSGGSLSWNLGSPWRLSLGTATGQEGCGILRATECLVPAWANESLYAVRPLAEQPACIGWRRIASERRGDSEAAGYYGLLTVAVPRPPKNARAEQLPLESLDAWQKEIRTLRVCTAVWDALADNDAAELRDYCRARNQTWPGNAGFSGEEHGGKAGRRAVRVGSGGGWPGPLCAQLSPPSD